MKWTKQTYWSVTCSWSACLLVAYSKWIFVLWSICGRPLPPRRGLGSGLLKCFCMCLHAAALYFIVFSADLYALECMFSLFVLFLFSFNLNYKLSATIALISKLLPILFFLHAKRFNKQTDVKKAIGKHFRLKKHLNSL